MCINQEIVLTRVLTNHNDLYHCWIHNLDDTFNCFVYTSCVVSVLEIRII